MKFGSVVLVGVMGLLAFSCSTGTTDPVAEGGTSSVVATVSSSAQLSSDAELSSDEVLSSGTVGLSSTDAGSSDAGSFDAGSSTVAASSVAASSVAASSVAASSSAGVPVPAALTFNVTTVDPNPNCAYKASGSSNQCYEPKMIMAVWIETAGGAFVRTVQRIGGTSRQQWLVSWTANSANNVVDAVTGATTTTTGTSFNAKTFNWNVQNTSQAVVPDGDYVLKAEFTSIHEQGPVVSIPFTVGPSSQTVNPANSTYMTNMSLVFTAAH